MIPYRCANYNYFTKEGCQNQLYSDRNEETRAKTCWECQAKEKAMKTFQRLTELSQFTITD